MKIQVYGHKSRTKVAELRNVLFRVVGGHAEVTFANGFTFTFNLDWADVIVTSDD